MHHEVELYDGDAGTLVAWIRLPSVRARSAACTNTVIFVYYGAADVVAPTEQPALVWDASYAAVWHLSEDPSLGSDCAGGGSKMVCDSTANNNHGDTFGTMTTADQVAGAVGGSLHFDGEDDMVVVPSSPSMDDIATSTISAWINPAGWGGGEFGRIYDKKNSASDGGYEVYIGTATTHQAWFRSNRAVDGLWATPNHAVTLDAWQHIAVTYDNRSASNVPALYVNGLAQTAPDQAPNGIPASDIGEPVILGNSSGGARGLQGLLDEVRVSTTQRSEHWIRATYNNQRWPDEDDHPGQGFYVVGAEELTG